MNGELTLAEAKKQIQQLIAENRKLAENLEAMESDRAALEKTTQQALRAEKKAAKALEESTQAVGQLRKQLTELRSGNRTLIAQVKRLNRQVEKTPLNPLTPEEAVALFDRLIQPFRLAEDLEVRDINLTLKVATGKLADDVVLLLPEPGAIDPASLHELKLNLRGTSAAESVLPGPVPVRG